MIAEYQRKIGFTAILVSHEIPDVYFISNRILALYERHIVFQGSPEELEDFNHPFKEEVINSLEGLQDELTGFYSRRQFKVRYRAELKSRGMEETYTVISFMLKGVSVGFGHEAVQHAIHCLGNYVEKHFGAVGGFSTRSSAVEFATVLHIRTSPKPRGSCGILSRISKGMAKWKSRTA